MEIKVNFYDNNLNYVSEIIKQINIANSPILLTRRFFATQKALS